jgi:hypothetical protein
MSDALIFRDVIELKGKGNRSDNQWSRALLCSDENRSKLIAELMEQKLLKTTSPILDHVYNWDFPTSPVINDDISNMSWGTLHSKEGEQFLLMMQPSNPSRLIADPRAVSTHSIGSADDCSITIKDERLHPVHFIIYIRHRHTCFASLCMIKNVSSDNIMIRCVQQNHEHIFIIQPDCYGPIDCHAVIIILHRRSKVDIESNYRLKFMTSPLEYFASATPFHQLCLSDIIIANSQVPLSNTVDPVEVEEYRQSITNQWTDKIWCCVVYKDVIHPCYKTNLLKPEGMEVVLSGENNRSSTKFLLIPSANSPLSAAKFVLKFVLSDTGNRFSANLFNCCDFDMAVSFITTTFLSEEGSRTIKLSPGMHTDLDQHNMLCLRGGYTTDDSFVQIILNPQLMDQFEQFSGRSYLLNTPRSAAESIPLHFWARVYNSYNLLYLNLAKTDFCTMTAFEKYTGSYCLIGRCEHCCIQLQDSRLAKGVHCGIYLIAQEDSMYYGVVRNYSATNIRVSNSDLLETSHPTTIIVPGACGFLFCRSTLYLVEGANDDHLIYNVDICSDFKTFRSPHGIADNNQNRMELKLDDKKLMQFSSVYNVYAFRLRSYLNKYYQGTNIKPHIIQEADCSSEYYHNTGRQIKKRSQEELLGKKTTDCCVWK